MEHEPKLTNTIHGLMDEELLARTVGFEERPNEFVVWVEYRLGEELVRRDAHVILKQASVVADAIAGGGGEWQIRRQCVPPSRRRCYWGHTS